MSTTEAGAIDPTAVEHQTADGATQRAVAPAASIAVHDVWAFRAAVVAVGAALSVFLIGAAVMYAVTKTVPNQYWTAGSAISGALIGILVPAKPDPPGTTLPTTSAATPVHTDRAPKAGSPEPWWKTPATMQLLNENLRPMILFTIFAGSLILSAILGSSQELHSLAAAAGGALIGVLVPAPSRHPA
jgi:hypothetical protein